MDLEEDLRAVLVNELSPGSDDSVELARQSTLDLLSAYANWSLRFPQAVPRTVLRSRELNRFLKRSGDLAAQARVVLREIERGDDLELRLSRDVTISWSSPKAPKRRQLQRLDRFLYAWGIHHLHLGNRRAGVRVQSQQLLFVSFIADSAYAIAVMPHRAWDQDVLLRIAADNWPENGPLLSSSREMSLGVDLSEDDRAALRRGHVSTSLPHNGRLYSSRDSLTVAGTSMTAATWAIREFERLKRAEKAFVDDPGMIIDELQRRWPGTHLSQPKWSIAIRDRAFAVVDSVSGKHLPLDAVPRA